MGYYVRVLSTSADCVSLSALQSSLEEDKLQATLSTEEGAFDDWAQLILRHDDGQEIALIERNPVEQESLGSDELAEFADEVAECKPANAATWLLDYFSRVRCVYALQVLGGTDHKNGWEIFGVVKNRIWSAAPSILQAAQPGVAVDCFAREIGHFLKSPCAAHSRQLNAKPLGALPSMLPQEDPNEM